MTDALPRLDRKIFAIVRLSRKLDRVSTAALGPAALCFLNMVAGGDAVWYD